MDPLEDRTPEKIREVIAALKGGQESFRVTVRELLRWFDAQRRGIHIRAWILECLEQNDLITEPDFRGIWIDGEIELRFAEATPTNDQTTSPLNSPDLENQPITSLQTATPGTDPTYRIGRLFAANKPVIGVTPDAEINQAITIMLQNDYSQLPVWTNERNVKGIITLRSILSRISLGLDYSKVRLCMIRHHEVRSEESFFDVIPKIVDAGYALVRGSEDRIVGVLTASDLSVLFRQLTEPFLLLSDIEQHIRKLIGHRVSSEELQAACDPNDRRKIERVSDLAFGEMCRLIENPRVWDALSLTLIDRKTTIAELHRVRDIRNDVMHFDPDPVDAQSLDVLNSFSRYLQHIDYIRSR